MAYQILVVSPDDVGRRKIAQVLAQAGYGVCVAATFADGKRLLAQTKPDLLITDERLADFNGLHLVLRGRFTNPHMDAIVTSPAHDREVERDAATLNARFVVHPKDPVDWLSCVSQAVAQRMTETTGVHHAMTVN